MSNQLTTYAGHGAGGPAPMQQAGINSETESFIATIGSRPVATKRNHSAILEEIRVLASVGASDLFYEFPVKNRRTGKTETISGPSIKLANTIAAAYGNCGVDMKVTETAECWVFAATFVDAEKGFTMRRLFRQRRSQKSIGPSRGEDRDDGRQEDIAFQIGQSKAIRNVVVNALPVYAAFALENAKAGLSAAIKRAPAKFKEAALRRLGDYEVPVEIVARWIGRAVDKWTNDDICRLAAALQGISDGLARIEDVWPDAAKAQGSADAPPAPPPPHTEKKTPPPSRTKAKAEPKGAGDAPPDEPKAFAEWLAARFGECKTADECDDVWGQHEARFTAFEESVQGIIVDAYNARRETITNAE